MRYAIVLLAVAAAAETVGIPGLKQPVEILRDRWGVPHIYAKNVDDLFFANGYMNARDRLFQMDLWRRVGAGQLAEVLGYQAVRRDRMALLFRYRGDWNAEWQSYSPDTRQIVAAFTNGVNAYIRSLHGRRPAEFQALGYDPGPWTPEDCLSRIAGLSISRNVAREVMRAHDAAKFGLDQLLRAQPMDPVAAIREPVPKDIPSGILREFSDLLTESPLSAGSNNWVVDGTKTASGKPLLASDPHRTLDIPPLRRTVHLNGPGWNTIGAGEPALPGISLGHNEEIAFGFTITGIDQQDMYIERLNPKNPAEYWHGGMWKRVEVEKRQIRVKGEPKPRDVELRFTLHGPVIYEDRAQNRAYALKWVGSEPGGAGYLASLALARAKSWTEFRAAAGRFKVPGENMLYADRAGNIGFVVAGLTPVRKNFTGLVPVPGTGEYEWSGYLKPEEMPSALNPAKHFIATANHKVIPPGYSKVLTYEWGPPYRALRIEELLAARDKFTAADFEHMQYDVLSVPARRFQAVLRRWKPNTRLTPVVRRMLRWDARLTADSSDAIIFQIWIYKLNAALFGADMASRVETEPLMKKLETLRDFTALESTLESALADLGRWGGPDLNRWRWGRLNQLTFTHDSGRPEWNRGPYTRGGDPQTVNASGAGGSKKGAGASYRQAIDLADWDRSTMTNAPGESGDPGSEHYADLIDDWLNGRYHPMPYSRKAVEAVTTERITLKP